MRKILQPTLIAAAVAAAFFAGSHLPNATLPPAMAATVASTAAPAPGGARVALPDFSALVQQHGPAVVNIAVVKQAERVPAQFDPGQLEGPMGEMLRRFGIPGPQAMPRGPQGPGAPEGRGVGSGFIISADGLVLTNAHVVDGATELRVRLPDQREFAGKVIGADKMTDVAVVKIDAKDLPTVRLGDPSRLKVGEWVAAIGSPFGLENSVTAGIVSAKSRSLPDERLVPFIQTDVAVNPGNSGGPLFNMDGEVVGINSQIFSTSGGSMGLSFAIPIDLAVRVKDQLVQHGKVTRGRIGVGIQPLDQALAESFGLDKPRGALVSKVEPGTPAAKAGLKEGDVIVEFGGRSVDKSNDLPLVVADTAPGSKVAVKIWRDRGEKTLELTVGAMDTQAVAVAPDSAQPQGKLGVAVRPLSPQEARQLGTEGGLLVQEAGGAAARAGIRPGDVIVAVNAKPVKGVDDLKRQIDESKGRVAVLVERDGQRVFVPVQIG
jgi:serine protease Do